MNCEKNTVASRDLASFAIRSVLLVSGGFIATTAAAQDECTSAVTLQLNTPTAFSTLTATASAGIPLDSSCPNTSLLWTSASPDVWFKWTAPSDGLATFNTCTADTAAIDTSIALYVGSCTSLVQVGCNGDMLHNNPGGCNVTDAKVANFPVSGGVTYYIRVAGIDSEFGVSRGNGQITVTHSHISAWGDNSFNQCDLPAGITNPSKMSIGDSHALAINSTGAVVAWGSNSLGQATVPAGLTSPRDVAAGSNFSLAVRSNGTLVGWGSNTSGRATPPTTVLDATKVAAGVFHGLALRSNGAVVAWGAGTTNTGIGSAFGQAIVPAAAQSGIAAIAAGNLHSLALTSQGAVIAWGAGTTDTGVTPRFGQAIVPTAAQSNVEKIAAGYYHSVALTRDGSVVCWGAGATNTGTLPHYGQSIVPAGLGVVSDIAAGRYHTVVLSANGTVTGWGLSTDYQTSVPSVTASASAVAAGGNVSFARFSPCTSGAPQTYYRDIDGDGFGTLVASVVSCTGAPAGYAPNALDCNDSLVTYVDADGDTYGAGSPAACGVASNSDCNDANAAVNPAASEVCDATNTDENCNGVADDLDALVLDAGRTNFYVDGDNDTYTLATSARFCDQPASGYHTTVSSPLDCNDANAGVNPGRSEICDATNTDENCNGSADDLDATVLESSKFNFYRDQDSDTYTVANATRYCDIVSGYLAQASAQADCNDTNAAINPGATEICDAANIDENCNSLADNADAGAADGGKSDFFADADSDTYTVAAASRFCDILSGYLAQASAQVDCNDTNAAINPGATEICDAANTDENCNNLADNADAGAADAGKSNFFADSDADSFSVSRATRFCDIVSGYLAQASAQADCNDTVAAINPGATEICDAANTDENCNSSADDADSSVLESSKSDFFADSDADTYTVAAATRFCDIVSGYLAQASAQADCNDTVAAINPGATEICDAANTDENCNNLADNADAGAIDASKSDFFADSDADTYTVAQATRFCDIVSGYLAQASAQVDCDDASNAIYPGAVELCATSTVDNNCDGIATDVDANAADKVDFFRDADGDGFTTAQTAKFCSGTVNAGWLASPSVQPDCDDASNAIYPGALELCATSTIDNNCDGIATDVDANAADKVDFFRDADGDGFTTAESSKFCPGTVNAGWLATPSVQPDCDDSSSVIYPGALELCATSTVDNNCDGIATDVDANAADKVDFFGDADRDGFTTAQTSKFCPGTVNEGWLATPSVQPDCDDASSAVHPGALELCADSAVDNNCNGIATDVDANAADKVDFFRDADLDGFTTAETAPFCPNTLQDGWLENPSNDPDCDDSSNTVFPRADELCATSTIDNNCDGVATDVDGNAADKINFFRDIDLDGFTTGNRSRFCSGTINSGWLEIPSAQPDCNDLASDIYPGAPELCSTATVDNNCDTVISDIDANAADKVDFFQDSDLDGFTIAVTARYCPGTANSGWLETASAQVDCDDASALTFPGAVELCSTATVDNNCDSVATDVDANAADKVDFFADSDNDGYTVAQTSRFCSGSVQSGWLETASAQADCNDSVNGINPSATEVCDAANVDENCNSVSDNDDAGALESSKSDFFADSDNDGYTVATASRFCDIVTGHLAQVSAPIDCNDASNAVYPGAAELCADATVDNNCDSVATDVDANASDKVNFFRDGDGDGYTTAQTSRFCSGSVQSGWLETASGQADCDDASASVHPGAVELCATSSVDNNCDGLSTDVDANAADKVDFFRDADLDAFTTVETSKFCSGGAPAGWSLTASAQVDCNDLDAAVNPAAIEICDLGDTDENCNGSSDNADTGAQDATRFDFFVDADGDGYGAGAASRWCDKPVGYATVGGDDCPSDPLKRVPGACGCGVVDVDANGNGIMDCVEIGVSMTPSLTVVRPGTQFDLVIGSAQVSVPVLGLQTSVAFDPTMLEVIDAVPSGPFDTLLGLQINNQIGRVSVAVGTFGEPVTSGASMISIRFAVKQGSPTDCDARDRISFYTNGSIATRFSRADGTPFIPVLEPLAALSIDGVAPSITSVPQGSVQADAGCTATVPSLVGSVVASDDCTAASGLVITQSPAAGSSLSAGSHQVSFTVTDAAGNSSVLVGALEVIGSNLDYYPDVDGDGFGSSTAAAQASCSPVAGKVTDHTDCDDSSAAVHPGAAELCADSTVDNNCDGVSTDVDALAADKVAFYRDGDGDGYTSLETAQFCAGTSNPGYRSGQTNPLDCNDADATIYPGAVENCANLGIDNDCDTIALSDEEAIDSIAYMLDSDADGFGAGPAQMSCAVVPGKVTNALDCNDGDPTINPNGVETCANMGIDNNCNGIANLDAEAIDCGSFCADLDGDGFGAGSVARACSQPSGHVGNALDCDDTQFLYADTDGDGVGAGAPAACGVPSNTDGCPDNAQLVAQVVYYADIDGDGAGDAAVSQQFCETTAPAGFSANSDDLCVSNAALLSPVTYYADTDGDGAGDAAVSQQFCETTAPAGFSANSNDLCVSNAALLSPVTYYADVDGDGFGNAASTVSVCETTAPIGHVTDSSDCNDQALLYADADSDGHGAGAPVACGVASNDDGCPNNADLLAPVSFYRDADSDGFGNAADSIQVCQTTAPLGYVTDSADCNDGALLYADADGDGRGAGAPVACGVATNDDGCPNNAALFAAATYYADVDADGFGNAGASVSICETTAPAGHVSDSSDCNDGALLYADADGDGRGAGAPVACGVTTNDDGCPDNAQLFAPATFYRDADNDGAGDANDTTSACALPVGFVTVAGDNCPANGALLSPLTYYRDADNDGAGDPLDSIQSCESAAPAGYAATAGDGCPTDPAKTSPGTCGCGVADTDTDGDGTPNCTDGCPNDPAKTSPGTCGCGVADTDTDGDGLANCVDNCPSIANPDQLDCNSNGTGDVCEIAAGTAQDCNTNGRIDSCDIASGVSTDLDASGKPDDCEFVVGGSGYGSIQAAIDFAPNGSVVKVAPGTWAPFVVNKRGLTVQAIGTREVTIVDGGAANRVVEVIGRASIRFTLRGFTIRNGRAAEGAGMLIIDADPLVENCVFTGNVASGPGGAVRATNSAADFALVVFTGNSAASGGAIANSGAAPGNGALHVSSSQFRQNTAATDGGAIVNSGGLFLLECTLEQNTAGSLGGGLRQLETGDTTVFTSRFCMNVPDNINGAYTGVGENILSGDCNANGLCDADEIASGTVGDCNTNGIPDSCDIAGGAADCNTNGIPDSCDIASGTSGDVDANGIPDECKPDCNNNDIPDAYEIATGATPDCNTNGIPDSCDIAANTGLDCNANGQLDSCEIAAGTVRDCNSNGIVDSCEIATGAADADNDGRLDRCEIARGDINLDGVVDAVDLASILTRWGPVSGTVAADINRDGFVDAVDLSVVLGGWGVVPNF